MAVDGAGLDITLTNYRDNLDFGIVVDRDQVPDVWNLLGYMREALDELVESVEPRSDRLAS